MPAMAIPTHVRATFATGGDVSLSSKSVGGKEGQQACPIQAKQLQAVHATLDETTNSTREHHCGKGALGQAPFGQAQCVSEHETSALFGVKWHAEAVHWIGLSSEPINRRPTRQKPPFCSLSLYSCVVLQLIQNPFVGDSRLLSSGDWA